jgi:NADH-quinone oxidoreductase subunit I
VGSAVNGPVPGEPPAAAAGLGERPAAGAGLGERPGTGVPPGERPVTGVPPGELPARSRGVIALLEENCTVCMLCVRECPDWCIYIESHKEPVPGPLRSAAGPGSPGPGARGPGSPGPGAPGPPGPRGRPRVRNALDRFAIDFSLCMYCGICVEVCPYDALFWSPDYGYAATDIRELTQERGRLREWMATVPPPPELNPGAPLARELQAAGGGAAGLRGDAGGLGGGPGRGQRGRR